MIPSDMNLKIRSGTAGYNNKILVSNGDFILGKNEKVNLTVSVIKSHKTNSLEPTTITTDQGLTHAPAISQKNQKPKTITHNEEKIAFVLFMAGGLAIWNMFRRKFNKMYGSPANVIHNHYINHMSVSLIVCELINY